MKLVLTGNTTFKLVNFREGLIKELISAGHKVIILAPRDNYVEDAVSLGCEYVELNINRHGMSVIEEFFLLVSFFNIFKQIRPDAVLSFTIKNNIYSGLVCRALGIPFLPNVTGAGSVFDSSSLIKIIVKRLYKISFGNAWKVFFQNKYDLDYFQKNGLVRRKCGQILPGSGVDLEKFNYSDMPEDPSEFRFLMVSRLLVDKGVQIFADAAQEIASCRDDVKFQLLGDHDPSNKNSVPLSLVEEWKTSGFLEYLGSTKDVRPHIRNSHCIVLPSFYREGTPRSLLEGAAIGRPIITTTTPGCEDLVPEQKNGFLVPSRDVKALKDALETFLNLSVAKRRIMSFESRKLVEKKYSERIVIDTYLHELDLIRKSKNMKEK